MYYHFPDQPKIKKKNLAGLPPIKRRFFIGGLEPEIQTTKQPQKYVFQQQSLK